MPPFVIEYYDARNKRVATIDVNAAHEGDACDKHGHRKARNYPTATWFTVNAVHPNGDLRYCVTDSVDQ